MNEFFLNIKGISIAAVTLSLLLVAGCGGSGSDPPITKAQFLKRATAICKVTNKELQVGLREFTKRKGKPSEGKGLKAEATELVDTVFVPSYRKLIDELRALGNPKGEEDKIDAILTAMSTGLEKSKGEALPLVRSSAPLHEAAKLAKAYGLTNCTG